MNKLTIIEGLDVDGKEVFYRKRCLLRVSSIKGMANRLGIYSGRWSHRILGDGVNQFIRGGMIGEK